MTGAGAVFCGGFAARLVAGAGGCEAATAGVVAASFAVERYGSLGLIDVHPRARDERRSALRGVMGEDADGS